MTNMNVKLNQFESGWVGLEMALSAEETDALKDRLEELKRGDIGHFHLRNDGWDAESGVADIQISLMGLNDLNNMSIN
jgi:hypothetical protein